MNLLILYQNKTSHTPIKRAINFTRMVTFFKTSSQNIIAVESNKILSQEEKPKWKKGIKYPVGL